MIQPRRNEGFHCCLFRTLCADVRAGLYPAHCAYWSRFSFWPGVFPIQSRRIPCPARPRRRPPYLPRANHPARPLPERTGQIHPGKPPQPEPFPLQADRIPFPRPARQRRACRPHPDLRPRSPQPVRLSPPHVRPQPLRRRQQHRFRPLRPCLPALPPSQPRALSPTSISERHTRMPILRRV